MGFATGTKFNLSDYPIKTQQGDYFFTRISHVACDSTALNPDNTTSTEGQLYSNTFSCLSMQINYRPLATSPKPKIYGTQTATVVGNGEPGQEISVDRYGRVRIQYHWHDISPGRVRVAQSWSGTNFGQVFHPRIGQEVLIQFEHGDPDRPIIIGMAHNSSNMPTYVPYDQPTRSGIKTRSSELGSSDEANELYFEDKKGSETVYMHAQKDHTCVIENNDSTTVGQGDHNINVAAR